MVFLEAPIPDRDPDPSRLSQPGPGVETSNPDHDATSVPLGIHMSVWLSVVTLLRVPHFSFTNRMGFQHEDHIPLVLGQVIEPRLPLSSSLFLRRDPRPCHAHRIAHHVCATCYEEVFTHNDRLGVLICGHCGEQAPYHESFSYKPFSRARTLPRTISDDFYKRTIYFREWLRRLQAKDRCHVRADDLHRLMSYMTNIPMTYWNVKAALKVLHLQRYYDHIVFLIKTISGQPLFDMTKAQEDRLVRMFCQLRRPFLELEKSRINMLSYPYLISKLCELQGWYKVARIIPTLKSPTRIREQDELWYRICQTTGWAFIATP
jgi:hypothetical protein